LKDNETIDDYDENDDTHHQERGAQNQSPKNIFPSHHKLEADLFELSSSIVAKEELIQQLQESQQKYEVRTCRGATIQAVQAYFSLTVLVSVGNEGIL
jgi:ribonuclease HIII